ncbi:MAG: alginate lyase family protein [Bacillota bacterium]
MKDLNFIVNRLMRMSMPEIAYRVRHKVQSAIEKRRLKSYKFNYRIIEDNAGLFGSSFRFDKNHDLIKKADELCSNRFDIFSLKNIDIGQRIDYHKDYKSGKSAPSHVFGKDIDYRNSDEIGDIKYIWEINRHLFMVILSIAYKSTKDEKYLLKFQYFLDEWLKQNPFMIGVNWSSSLELGIRLINWTFSWHLLGDSINENLRKRWLESVYCHSWFIYRNFSAYSSANNHLIGEAAGLFAVSTTMPKFDMSKKWQQRSYEILVRECQKQNYRDGVNKEQALSYQQFVLDFLLICGIIGKANNKEFPDSYWFIIEKMLVYLASMEDVTGNLPHTGDEDDGFVLDLLQSRYGPYRSLLNTGAYLFERSEFLKGDREIDIKTKILLGMINLNIGRRPDKNGRLPVKFEEGGYYILGTDFNGSREQKLIFDCGPLGYLSIAAHGHADALSFYFSAGGSPVFVDPGTYAYHANKRWRSYFRGTASHNTALVDGKDQSVMAGNFMWSSKARSALISYKESCFVKGYHDGYERLKDKVRHVRSISFDKEKNRWQIEDEFISKGKHEILLHFHLHPQCSIESRDNTIIINFDKGICKLNFNSGLDLNIYKGDDDTQLGWYSESYDSKVPSYTIKLSKTINGTEKICTDFEVKFH